MPVLTQLNLNVGTEQNPNMVLHDLHDIRISSTDVTTVTRLLGCDAGVKSIAPLTLANAASLLGALIYSTNIKENTTVTDLNAETGDSKRFSRFFVSTQSVPANLPNGVSSIRFFLEIYNVSNYYILQKIYITQISNFAIYYRSKFGDNNWTNWKTIA